MDNVLKNTLLEKLAKAALRKAGGLEIRNVENVKIAVFDLSTWEGEVNYPAGMEGFKKEQRTILGKEIVFLFPQNVRLEKAA